MANCIIKNDYVKKACEELLDYGADRFDNEDKFYNHARLVLTASEYDKIIESISDNDPVKEHISNLFNCIDIDGSIKHIRESNPAIYDAIKAEIGRVQNIFNSASKHNSQVGWNIDKDTNVPGTFVNVSITNTSDGSFCVTYSNAVTKESHTVRNITSYSEAIALKNIIARYAQYEYDKSRSYIKNDANKSIKTSTVGRVVLDNGASKGIIANVDDIVSFNGSLYRIYGFESPSVVILGNKNGFVKHTIDLNDQKTYLSEPVQQGEELNDDGYTAEMQSIKDKAISDGTFMKAPNGKRTNLNERQWLLVRTKAFKMWFGDWENVAKQTTPVVKSKYKGKLIFAQSGTGKSTIADNVTVIDSDYLLGKILGVNAENAGYAFNLLNPAERARISKLYKQSIRDEVKKGHTVVTANVSMIDEVDVVVYNKSAELADNRTSGDGRHGKNRFSDLEYHSKTIDKINEKIASDSTKEYVALDENTYLGDVILDEKPAPKQNGLRVLKHDAQRFLANFGITLQEAETFDGDLFNALDRVVNAKSDEDITEGVGRAIAFMMQHDDTFRDYVAFGMTNANGVKGITRKSNAVLYRGTRKSNIGTKENIDKVGHEIAVELKKLYNIDNAEQTKDSFSSKIMAIIDTFFKILSDAIIRLRLSNASAFARDAAQAVMDNNKGFVIKNYIKPGTDSLAQRVSIEQALKDNPYEESIVSLMTNNGIALEGGACVALEGTMYRPAENPLHDLDFRAKGKTKDEIESMLNGEFNFVLHTNTIDNSDDGTYCLTYLVIDRPIREEPIADSKAVHIVDATTGEVIGMREYSELVLKDGVQGKMLDFFMGSDKGDYPNKTFRLNGKDYLISNYKNAMKFNVNVAREKDIWDYNRFIQDDLDASNISDASRVVDENREPLVVYHHTDNPDLSEFSTDFDNYFAKDGGTKKAIFFDENPTGTLNRKHDIPVFLNIRDLHEYNETKEQLHRRGTTYREVVNQSAEQNDVTGGVHMADFDDNKMEHQSIWIAHNPNQVKSAKNNTEFSSSKNIFHGTVTFNSEGEAIVDPNDIFAARGVKVDKDYQANFISHLENDNIGYSDLDRKQIVEIAKALFDFFEKSGIKVTILNRPFSKTEQDVRSSLVQVSGKYATIYYVKQDSQESPYMTVLHEMLHVATTDASPFETEGREIEDEQLGLYYSMFVRHINSDSEFMKYEPKIRNAKSIDELNAIPIKYRILYHARESAGEFISSFINEPIVRQEVSNITTDEVKKKTLFEDLVEYIKDLFAKIFKGHDRIMTEDVLTSVKDFLLNYKYQGTYETSYDDGSKIDYTKDKNLHEAALDYKDVIKYKQSANTQPRQAGARLAVGNNIVPNPEDYVMHSGGANGSDFGTVKDGKAVSRGWGLIGLEYGVRKQNHYHGSNKTPYGNIQVSSEDMVEGARKVALAAKANYGYEYETMKNELLIRNWAQVKYADAVFAIGHFVKPGERLFPNEPNDLRVCKNPHGAVTGGTGYTVEMAVQAGKPVYVFDQERNQWYAMQPGAKNWVKCDTPVFTKNFAGIGTGNINAAGIQAIENVYRNTFGMTIKERLQHTASSTVQQQQNDSTQTLGPETKINISQTTPNDNNDTYSLSSLDDAISIDDLGIAEPQKPSTERMEQIKQDVDEYNSIKPIDIGTQQAVERKKTVLLPQVARDGARFIMKYYKMYIDKALYEYNIAIEEEAQKRGISVSTLKYELRKQNQAIYDKWKADDFISDEDRAKIALLDEACVVDRNTQNKIMQVVKANMASFAEKAKREGAVEVSVNMQSVLECFDVLAREAMSIMHKEYGMTAADEYVESNEEVKTNDAERSYNPSRSTEVAMSQEVRNIYDNVFMTYPNGHFMYDTLHHRKPVNKSYLHAKVLDTLRHMHKPSDMIRMMWNMEGGEGKQILMMFGIDKPDMLPQTESQWQRFNAFYSNYHMYFKTHFVVMKNKNGKWVTKAYNKPTSQKIMLESVINNIGSGKILASKSKSLYTNNSEHIVNLDAKDYLVSLADEITSIRKNNLYNIESISEDDVKTIMHALKCIGINESLGRDRFLEILRSNKKGDVTSGFSSLCSSISQIIYGVYSKYENSSKQAQFDIVNSEKRYYDTIINMLAVSEQDNAEASSFIRTKKETKTIYNYTKPCYLSELIEHLKRPLDNGSVEYKKYYDGWMERTFGQYDFFYDATKGGRNRDGSLSANGWRSKWLRMLNDGAFRNGIDHCDVLATEYVEYTDWGPVDARRTMWEMYWFNDSDQGNLVPAWFKTPLLSDSPAGDFIKFYRSTGYGYMDYIMDGFTDVFEQEMSRIKTVRGRMSQNIANPIASYDPTYKDGKLTSLGGMCFKFMPALNYILVDTKTHDFSKFSETQQSGEKLRDIIINNGLDGKPFIEVVDRLSDTKFQAENGINDTDVKTVFKTVYSMWLNDDIQKEYDRLKADDDYKFMTESRDKFFEYEMNTRYAKSQIIQLTTTDLAFYGKVQCKAVDKSAKPGEYNIIIDGVKYKITKDDTMDVFQKRFKEVHAPSKKAQTEIGKDYEQIYERTLYLNDVIRPSIDFDLIKKTLEANPNLSEIDRQQILSAYKSVNIADAQAYRSLSSYKRLMGQMGKMTPELKQAIENIEQGKFDIGDWNLVFQTLKPYVFTRETQNAYTQDVNGNDIKLSVPVQHKNSEFVLLAMYDMAAQCLGGNTVLAALNKFMENHNIDVIQFESTVKVGKQGCVKVEDEYRHPDGSMMSVDEIVKSIEDNVGAENFNNPEVVHTIETKDWGIQTETPEHIIDKIQLVGTQVRKLIFSDMPDDFKVTIGNVTMTKNEWMRHYNDIITENIIKSFVQVSEIFSDPKKLSEFLIEEIQTSNKYDTDMIEACTWNENEKRFNIPLNNPITSLRVQELMNSLLKNRVTKQKIRGGACIQVSNFGSKKLHIKYKKDGSIDYMECYMPLPTHDGLDLMLAECLEPRTDGSLWFKNGVVPKQFEPLLKAIGYRVPTENTYSMAPLKVVGFLPQRNGSAIMLPDEITTIAGSDFDVDKLYIMMYEFKKINYDMKKARARFAEVNEGYNEIFGKYADEELLDDETGEKFDAFNAWFEGHKQEFYHPHLVKIKYDFENEPSKQSRKARNNGMLDLMWASLTSQYHAAKFLNPGGFDEQRRQSRIHRILNNITKEELVKELGITDINDAVEKLHTMEFEELDAISSRLTANADPLSDSTFVMLHQRNMVGLNMVSVFAVYNILQPLLQQGNYVVNDSFLFHYNDKEPCKFGSIVNNTKEKQNIARLLSGYLAAAVDNNKDPVMADLGLTMDNVNICAAMSLMGYNVDEVASYLNHPLIKFAYKTYAKTHDFEASMCIALETFFKNKDFKKSEATISVTPSKLDASAFNMDNPGQEEYDLCIRLSSMAYRIHKISTSLSNILGCSRYDTHSGGAGPRVIDDINSISKLEAANIRLASTDKNGNHTNAIISKSDNQTPIKPISIPKRNIDETNEQYADRIRYAVSENKELTFMQAFYNCGVQSSTDLFAKYFSEYNRVVSFITSMFSNSEGVVDDNISYKIVCAYTQYMLTKTKLFKTEEDPTTGAVITADDKRKYFIMKFPEEFEQWVNSLSGNNEYIKNLTVIQRLSVRHPDAENPFKYIAYANTGNTTKEIRDNLKLDFDILNSSGPEGRSMAIKLFMYCVYRNGLGFESSGYMHLFSSEFMESIPGYTETLQTILDGSDYNDVAKVARQIFQNNPSLAPEATVAKKVYKGGVIYEADITQEMYDRGLGIIRDSNYNLYSVKKVGRDYFIDGVIEQLGFGNRYHEYCGSDEPKTIFTEKNVRIVESFDFQRKLDEAIATRNATGNNMAVAMLEAELSEKLTQEQAFTKVEKTNNMTDSTGEHKC